MPLPEWINRNLDCIPTEERWRYFHDVSRLKGETDEEEKVLAILRDYSLAKCTAEEERKRGYINSALHLEEICDDLYKQLPEEYRW